MMTHPRQKHSRGLTSLRIFQRIQRLENQYTAHLSHIGTSFSSLVELVATLERTIRDIRGLIKSLIHSGADSTLKQTLDNYLNEIHAIHENNKLWISLYLDLSKPQDKDIAPNIRRKAHDLALAPDIWDRLKGSAVSQRAAEILSLKEKLKGQVPNSYPWRKDLNGLLTKCHDYLTATLRKSRPKFQGCFKKTVYSLNQPTESIHDWIDGYKESGAAEIALEQHVNAAMTEKFRKLQTRRTRNIFLRNLAIFTATFIFWWFLHVQEIDRRITQMVGDRILMILKLDPASQRARQQGNYFQQKILDIDRIYNNQVIARHLRYFLKTGMHATEQGHLYFAENILKGSFLLIAKGKLHPELKNHVLNAAGLLDKNIQSSLTAIIDLFASKEIKESQLKHQLLNLREAFIPHGVFPFMFITLHGDSPYLFLYPEKIQEKFEFSLSDLKRLNLNPDHYPPFDFPLTAYVVAGDRYPFQNRAGYFEGRYAVVFASLAPKKEWTVWHELGHMVDELRYIRKGIDYPENIEVHAMLFPVIFSDDPKEYLLQRIIPYIKSRNAQDNYVQAAKGILNGVTLGTSVRGKPLLITDRFETPSLLTVENRINSLSNEQLHTLAVTMYQEPGKYLSTAKEGRYLEIFKDAEEIISGSHGPPQQGFILSGYGQSGSGPRFIFDGSEDTELFNTDFFTFLGRVFARIFNSRGIMLGGDKIEAFIAALVAFIAIEGVFVFIGYLGTPMRKRKFYGRSLQEIINRTYNKHPWSDGLNRGQEKAERGLLNAVFEGKSGKDLFQEIRAFRQAANDKQRLLFDILLTLAPFNPQKSHISNKAHLLLFWLPPFLGPYLARSPWLFRKQNHFAARERFNARIMQLVQNVNSMETLKNEYYKIINEYKASPSTLAEPHLFKNHLNEIEHLIFNNLNDLKRTLPQRTPTVNNRSVAWICADESGHDFDRLDVYNFGDDIKRIDWNATARSAAQQPKIRKYKGDYGARLALLIDLRKLNQPGARQGIAKDFINSLQALGQDDRLTTLIGIMPNGTVYQHSILYKNYRHILQWANAVLGMIKTALENYQAQIELLRIPGLNFYTDEENKRYQDIVRLTDFNQENGDNFIRQEISVYSHTIFMIGVTMEQKEELEGLLPPGNQCCYWEEVS